MSDCSGSCSTCDNDCKIEKEGLNEHSRVKKVICVVSGKGGVGKSLVTTMLAVTAMRRDHKTAILDADILGPSIPKMLGVREKAQGGALGIFPGVSKFGIKVMSANMMLENDTDPVLWRGPVLGGMVKQFWTDVLWEDVDYMFVDMPPGTGDVPLTVYQSLPIDGVIVVSSPQDLVQTIAEKAVNMAKLMNIPILGIVENMSYFKCPSCDEKHFIFGQSDIEKKAVEIGVEFLGHLPIEPDLASLCDKGLVELFEGDPLSKIMDKIENL